LLHVFQGNSFTLNHFHYDMNALAGTEVAGVMLYEGMIDLAEALRV
jgi:hypothetical protein